LGRYLILCARDVQVPGRQAQARAHKAGARKKEGGREAAILDRCLGKEEAVEGDRDAETSRWGAGSEGGDAAVDAEKNLFEAREASARGERCAERRRKGKERREGAGGDCVARMRRGESGSRAGWRMGLRL
jgi:hypothetical protein